MIKLKDILKEVDMGPISSKGEKTIKVKHKTSGKTLVVVDTPASRKKYTKMGYILPLPKHLKKIVIEGKLTERKFEMKGKYLYMPDGSMSSIPGDRDREDIVFSIGQKTFRLSSFGPGGKKMYIRGDYDKQFKNVNDLVKWLNKNKAKYIGLDN